MVRQLYALMLVLAVVAVGAGEVFNLFGGPSGSETLTDASLEVGGAAVINTGTNQVPGDKQKNEFSTAMLEEIKLLGD